MLKTKQDKILGMSWFILSLFISCLNDVITKYSGYNLHPFEVVFFRFLFGTLSLLPVMFYCGSHSFKTTRPVLHFIRGLILFVAIGIWCVGLNLIPIVSATLLTFTIPLFVLVLAFLFLKENVNLTLWTATLFGFMGIIFVLHPHSEDFNLLSLIMLVSAFLFALLDIINRKFISQEGILGMMFYSTLTTAILGIVPAIYFWQTPALKDLMLLFCLGVGSNFILFCLLKSFSYIAASSVAPYRYLELLLSAGFGYSIFGEIPGSTTYIGAAIIIPTTLFIAYRQIQNKESER